MTKDEPTPAPIVTDAMIDAGRKCWVDAITDPAHDGSGGPVFTAMFLAMQAAQPVVNSEVMEVLRECEDYFAERADAETDAAGTHGNAEMQLLVAVRDALKVRRA